VILEFIRDTSKVMPVSDVADQIRCLRVWHCKYKTNKEISHYKNLVELEIAGFKEESFDILSGLKGLKSLRVLHMPKLMSLSGLEALDNLEALSLETLPSWDSSSKKTIVESYEPLLGLNKLASLNLLSIVPEQRSIKELACLSHLRSAQIAGVDRRDIEAFFSDNSHIERKYRFQRF